MGRAESRTCLGWSCCWEEVNSRAGGLGAGAAVGPGGAPRPLERMLGRRHLAKVHSWREGVGVPHGGGPARQGPHCVCDPQGRAGRPWGPASILAGEGHTDRVARGVGLSAAPAALVWERGSTNQPRSHGRETPTPVVVHSSPERSERAQGPPLALPVPRITVNQGSHLT